MDLTAQDKDGNTPLHVALLEGQMEFTHIFIKRGADLTAQNKYVGTALHLASHSGQVVVTRVLIERSHGCNFPERICGDPFTLGVAKGTT